MSLRDEIIKKAIKRVARENDRLKIESFNKSVENMRLREENRILKENRDVKTK